MRAVWLLWLYAHYRFALIQAIVIPEILLLPKGYHSAIMQVIATIVGSGVYALTVTWMAMPWLRRSTGKTGHCQSCGYSLTGNTSGVCPECGTAVNPTTSKPMA